MHASSVETGEASVPDSVASPQPDGKDTGLGEANSTALSASVGVKKSSKARKGPRQARFETTLTQAKLAQAKRMAQRCSVSLPELVRNWLDGFEEEMLRRAEAHAQAADRVTHPPAAK